MTIYRGINAGYIGKGLYAQMLLPEKAKATRIDTQGALLAPTSPWAPWPSALATRALEQSIWLEESHPASVRVSKKKRSNLPLCTITE